MHKVVVYDGLQKLPPDADALFSATAETHGFFLSKPWFENLAECGGLPAGGARLYGLHDGGGGRLELLLPLYASTERFGVRRLNAFANWYSSLYAPLAAQEQGNRDGLRLMLQRIIGEAPRWDMLELRPLDIGSPLFADTREALRAAGMAVQSFFCFVNWYLRVEGRSYEQYAQSLPSTLRNTLKRKGRQLEKSGRAEFRIVSGDDADELEAAIDAYCAVYRNSWKAPEPAPQFLPALIRLCARQRWLRLGVARVDGEPAAVQLWIVCNGVASIYKLAYDERYAALSIGSLLTARMMQHVIDVDRVREVDYLTGDDAYKRDWMSHSRERHGLVAYNLRSARGLALAALHLGGGRLKRLARRIFHAA